MAKRTWPWLALLAGVLVWFFHDSLFAGRSLVPTDLLHQLYLPYSASVTNVSVVNHYTSDALVLDYPWGVFWQRTVKAGELPLWDPYIYGGHPHFAESMPAVFSPFKALYLFLSAERAFTLGIIAQFFLTAFAMFAFLRQLGRSPVAAFIGSCAWALNSALLLWYWRAPAAFCWAPLILLLIERRHAVAAGVVFGIAVVSGNAQAATHLAILCAAWWALHRQYRLAVVMFVVGALVSAVQWLPTLELMRLDAYHSLQTRGAWASVRHTVLGLPALITFVFPALTGSMETYDLLKLAGASRGDFAGYIGIVPVTLALVAVTANREHRIRWLAGIIGLVVVALLFTPLVKYLYHRFFIIAVFAGCVLAAEGADVALAAPEKCRRVLRFMLNLGAIVLVVVIAAQWVIATHRPVLTELAQQMMAGRRGTFVYKTAWFPQRLELFLDHYRITNIEFWLPLGCLAGLALTLRRYTVLALVLFTVVDLSVLGRRLVPQIDLSRYPLRMEHPLLEPALADRDLFRVFADGPNNWFIFGPNLLLAAGIANLIGNASISPAGPGWLLRQAPDTHASNVVLNLANVRYVFTETEVSTNQCFPRARWVSRAEVGPLTRLWSESFSPATTVLLEQDPGSLGGTGTVEITHYSANHVTARTHSDGPGMLVLADTFYPGWRARVDGQPARIYRAYGCMRAVVVPGGEHVVEFSFRSATIMIGAIVSLLTVAGLVVFKAWRK